MIDNRPEIPDPGPEAAPKWADRDMAVQEEKNWASLDKISNRNDSLWLSTYGLVVVVFTVSFATLFVLTLFIWSCHYLMPEEWAWLSADQLSKVQSVLFSGGMGAIVSSIVQKQLSKSPSTRK